jgi:hypothetical protein
MSLESFDAIVKDQFPQSLDQWYEFGFDEEYCLLEPESAVGEMAVRLQEENARTSLHLRWCRENRDPDDEALQAAKVAMTRWAAFYQLYCRLWRNLSNYEAGQRPIQYGQVVMQTCEEEIEHITDSDRPTSEKSGLVKLVREAGTLYQMEPEAHFGDLDTYTAKSISD